MSSRIAQLKERYQRSLGEKADRLQDYIQELPAGDANTVSELQGYLHQLAGSAGMYEYDEIAASCRTAMRLGSSVEMLESNELRALPELLRSHISD